MAQRKETMNEWSQGNRDLLVELKTQMVGVVATMNSLHTEMKEIKDGMKSDIEFLKSDKVSRAEVTRLQVDAQVVHNDQETRIRFIERYMWLALGGLAVIEFGLNYFHPFAK